MVGLPLPLLVAHCLHVEFSEASRLAVPKRNTTHAQIQKGTLPKRAVGPPTESLLVPLVSACREQLPPTSSESGRRIATGLTMGSRALPPMNGMAYVLLLCLVRSGLGEDRIPCISLDMQKVRARKIDHPGTRAR